MPELDEMLHALIEDTRRGARAPGAAEAVARGRRQRAAAAAVGAVTIGAAAALALSTVGGGDDRSTLAAPGSPSPTPPLFQEDPQVDGADFRNPLRAALTSAAGWTIRNQLDIMVLRPCDGPWSVGESGASGGSISIDGVPGGPNVWSDGISFGSEAQAFQAFTRLVQNLETCTTTAWTAIPIGQTGAVLVTSADAVAWLHQKGRWVSTLQVPTADGAPPVDVQLEVARLIDAWFARLT